MSDFCKQCSIKIFKEDFKDLAGLGQRAEVLCEECGPIFVNMDGERMGTSDKEPYEFFEIKAPGEER
jgi:hypothetical protein